MTNRWLRILRPIDYSLCKVRRFEQLRLDCHLNWTWCCYGNREYVICWYCWILWSDLLLSLPDKPKTRVKFWEASKGLTFSEKTATLNHMPVIGRFDWLSVRLRENISSNADWFEWIERVPLIVSVPSTFWDKMRRNIAEIRIWNMNQGLFCISISSLLLLR